MANVEDRLSLKGSSGKEYELRYTVANILRIEKLLPGNNLYKYVTKLFNTQSLIDNTSVMSFSDLLLFFRYHNPTVKYKDEESAGMDLQDVLDGNDIFTVQATILAALGASGIFGKTNSSKGDSKDPN